MNERLNREVVRAAINLTGAQMGSLQLNSDGALRLTASRGFGPGFLDFFDTVRDDDCACGTALRSGAAVIVEDVRASPIFFGKPSLAVMLDAGALSVVSMPIVARSGPLLGMLSTQRSSIGAPEPVELMRLEWLSRQVADVIEGTASGFSIRAIEIHARTDGPPSQARDMRTLPG